MGLDLALLLAFLSTGGDSGVATRVAPPKPGVCLREGSLLGRAAQKVIHSPLGK